VLAARQPPARSVRAAEKASLPGWGCDGPPHGTAPASFAPDPRGHRTRRKQGRGLPIGRQVGAGAGEAEGRPAGAADFQIITFTEGNLPDYRGNPCATCIIVKKRAMRWHPLAGRLLEYILWTKRIATYD
jgi:hypothetical protein